MQKYVFHLIAILSFSLVYSQCAPEMEWICGDMTKLTDTFDANTFDVVVDKAAMDAIMVTHIDISCFI